MIENPGMRDKNNLPLGPVGLSDRATALRGIRVEPGIIVMTGWRGGSWSIGVAFRHRARETLQGRVSLLRGKYSFSIKPRLFPA